MTMMDQTFDYFVKAFRLKTKELTRVEALSLGADLQRFFAVEMSYKGRPVRMIVCATGVPGDLIAPRPAALAEKNTPDAESKIFHQAELETDSASPRLT
jgi:hypothetical protein